MGLDLALGAVVLIAAIRGWLKGFLSQVISLAALVGCVYLANPLRDAAKPFVREYLPSMHADVLDRLLWWSSAVVTYVAMSGLAHWVLRFKKRQPYGLSEPNRANQGAGFLLGAAKGAVVACFLAAGFAQFAPKYIPEGGAVDSQSKSSLAMAWNERYHPAQQLWDSRPVQVFVAQVRVNGLGLEAEVSPEESKNATAKSSESKTNEARPTRNEAHSEPVKTARRPSEMRISGERRLDPDSPTLRDDINRELKRLGIGPDKSR
jgi:uncharacterized membrane protein required for colicin V production